MTDNLIYFDPKPITDLLSGYLADFGTDIVCLRRNYKQLGTKQKWTREELDTFKMSIIDTLKHLDKELNELEAEAGAKIP